MKKPSFLSSLRSKPKISLGGLDWDRNDFCAGWLITGGTGTGKTRSGLLRLLYEAFRCHPKWGGLVIDDKGNLFESLVEMAKHFGRENDVILLGPSKPHKLNLTGETKISFQTYGRIVVDTAIATGQRREQSFFRAQARDQIAAALECLSLTDHEVTLENVYNLLSDREEVVSVVSQLKQIQSPQAQRLIHHLENRFLSQPREQLGGVQGTVSNYLSTCSNPIVSEIFCRPSTFSFGDIDDGKILCLSMPQNLAVERKYLNTFLKQRFYFHALSRFDREEQERQKMNLLLLWADEAQHFVTDSEDGLSDYNAVDRIREARTGAVFATQSILSFVPPLGREKAQVLCLNLRNRLIFQAASDEDAKDAADCIGKRPKGAFSSKNSPSRSTESEETHIISPARIRRLRKHEAFIVHTGRVYRRALLSPLEPDGRVSSWFPWYRRVFSL